LALVSKLQYRSFEPGEFVESKARDFEELIRLIETFPWAEQRKGIEISLTNPSITIEGLRNDYLKLAVFYNQKYVLHYLSGSDVLYTMSFSDIRVSFPVIEHFLTADAFDLSAFHKENTWLQKNRRHFETKEFTYTVTPKSAIRFLFRSSMINFIFGIFVLGMLLIKGWSSIPVSGLIILLPVTVYMGGVLNLIVFRNQYQYIKHKQLKMSKGNDIFYVYDESTWLKFSKSEIAKVVLKKDFARRGPVMEFTVVTLHMANGYSFAIPAMMLDRFEVFMKLDQPKYEEEAGLPLIYGK